MSNIVSIDNSICIIIIVYNPDLRDLRNLISKIFQTETSTDIILVYNSSMDDIVALPRVHHIHNESNIGIGGAQNTGLSFAKNNLNFEFLLFLDQDSDIPEYYISNIIESYLHIEKSHSMIAALGPRVFNSREGEFYKSRSSILGDKYFLENKLINSGMLARAERFFEIGFFKEDLFIDFVDFEWCWRANSMGFKCFMENKLILNHKVGEYTVSFLGLTYIISSPIRFYYQYRNTLLLQRLPYVPLKWKIISLIKSIIFIFYLQKNLTKNILIMKYIKQGVRDGLSGKVGKISLNFN